MGVFICPVCKQTLTKNDKTYTCENHHSFDISKDGYVNLLISQASSKKRHGDDKLMARSRRDFLDGGYYEPLKNAVAEAVERYASKDSFEVDVGCGEGYYTESVERLCGTCAGIDISKDALKFASKRLKKTELCVASAFSLPFADKSADAIVNIFAPCAYPEFSRILKDGGCLIKAVPLCEHLWELKCALYDKPYKNKPELRDESLFSLVDFKELKYSIDLDGKDDIFSLFTMTPYYYKTSADDAKKLLTLPKLTVTAHFGIEVYKRKEDIDV